MAEQIDSAPEWRVIPSFPEYEASSDGQVRRIAPQRPQEARFGTGYVLKPRMVKGYVVCALKRPNEKQCRRLVHRLVCEAFHGPAPSAQHEVAHWDGDKANNRHSNLRWATKVENAADTIRLGKQMHGEQHHFAKLAVEQVQEIRRRKAIGTGYPRLAKEFGVRPWVIFQIVHRQTWKHIP
jgi:hypothetical protein